MTSFLVSGHGLKHFGPSKLAGPYQLPTINYPTPLPTWKPALPAKNRFKPWPETGNDVISHENLRHFHTVLASFLVRNDVISDHWPRVENGLSTAGIRLAAGQTRLVHGLNRAPQRTKSELSRLKTETSPSSFPSRRSIRSLFTIGAIRRAYSKDN